MRVESCQGAAAGTPAAQREPELTHGLEHPKTRTGRSLGRCRDDPAARVDPLVAAIVERVILAKHRIAVDPHATPGVGIAGEDAVFERASIPETLADRLE